MTLAKAGEGAPTIPQLHTYSDSFLEKYTFNNLALGNNTQNGSVVDTLVLGAPPRRAAFSFAVSTGASTTANFQIQDSADNSNWTNVSGGTLSAAINASTATSQIVNIDLAKRQRYLRAAVIGTGTNGNATGCFRLFQPEQAGIPTGSQDATPLSI